MALASKCCVVGWMGADLSIERRREVVKRVAKIRRAELDQRRAALVDARDAVAAAEEALETLDCNAASLAATVRGEPDLLVQLSEEVLLKGQDLDQRLLREEARLLAAQDRVVEARGELRTAELFLDRNRR